MGLVDRCGTVADRLSRRLGARSKLQHIVTPDYLLRAWCNENHGSAPRRSFCQSVKRCRVAHNDPIGPASAEHCAGWVHLRPARASPFWKGRRTCPGRDPWPGPGVMGKVSILGAGRPRPQEHAAARLLAAARSPDIPSGSMWAHLRRTARCGRFGSPGPSSISFRRSRGWELPLRLVAPL